MTNRRMVSASAIIALGCLTLVGLLFTDAAAATSTLSFMRTVVRIGASNPPPPVEFLVVAAADSRVSSTGSAGTGRQRR
jgi:hypothetical protein